MRTPATRTAGGRPRCCVHRERRNLARTLQDNDQVIRTLEGLVGACMHVLALFGYAWIFGADVGHLVLSLSSMGLACAFVFGNSLRTIYESVVFLFIIRPYQVRPASHAGARFGPSAASHIWVAASLSARLGDLQRHCGCVRGSYPATESESCCVWPHQMIRRQRFASRIVYTPPTQCWIFVNERSHSCVFASTP